MRNRRSLTTFALLLGACLASAGCGVIFGYGGPQPIKVASSPEGCIVEVDGVAVEAVTPTTITVHPKADHTISVKKKGYISANRTVTKVIRTDIVILDAVLTLGIGLLVDYMSGALYRLDESVKLNLGKVSAVAKKDPVVKPTKPTGTTKPKVDPNAEPCTICGEPRGDVSPCPHCGIE